MGADGWPFCRRPLTRRRISHPRVSFGNWALPPRRRQVFCAASTSLKTMASAVRFDRHHFDRGAQCMVASGAFDRVRTQMLPMLAGELVESQQRIATLVKAFGCFLVFYLVAANASKPASAVAFAGHPNILLGMWGLRLLLLQPAWRARSRPWVTSSSAPRAWSARSRRWPSTSRAGRRRFGLREPASFWGRDSVHFRVPSANPKNSLRPSGVAPISTTMDCFSVFKPGLGRNAVCPDVHLLS